MKTCAEIMELLTEYVEGGLDASSKSEVISHLEGCADCRRETEALQGLLTHLRGLGDAKAPVDLAARIRARIEKKQRWGEWLWQFRMPAAATAGLALVLTGTLLYFTAPREQEKIAERKDPPDKPELTLPAVPVMKKEIPHSLVGQVALTALGEKILGKESDRLPPIRVTVEDPAAVLLHLKEWVAGIPEAELEQKEEQWAVRLPVDQYAAFMEELKKIGAFDPPEAPAFEKKFFRVELYLIPKE